MIVELSSGKIPSVGFSIIALFSKRVTHKKQFVTL